jgi:hypothetical protein
MTTPFRSTEYAVESSTFVVGINLLSEVGSVLIPNSLYWTLVAPEGAVVNSRQSVGVTPASSLSIVLHGADLVVYDTKRESETRRMIVHGSYNSVHGTGIEISDSLEFIVYNTNKQLGG